MNMKPEWTYAPDWAMWLAQDANSAWHWYEYEPRKKDWGWSVPAGRKRRAVSADWDEVKEWRPEYVKPPEYCVEPNGYLGRWPLSLIRTFLKQPRSQ